MTRVFLGPLVSRLAALMPGRTDLTQMRRDPWRDLLAGNGLITRSIDA